VCRTGLTGVEPLGGSRQLSPAGTGLTGGAHRSDRCKPWWVFARVNIWVSLLVCCVGAISSLGLFGGLLACLVIWGFLAMTGLTGVLHRPDRCGAT
jgi:hypothetical protein